jgi:hypothetical protein
MEKRVRAHVSRVFRGRVSPATQVDKNRDNVALVERSTIPRPIEQAGEPFAVRYLVSSRLSCVIS